MKQSDILATEKQLGYISESANALKIVEENKGRKLTAEPKFFHAQAENGVIRVPALDGKEVVA